MRSPDTTFWFRPDSDETLQLNERLVSVASERPIGVHFWVEAVALKCVIKEALGVAFRGQSAVEVWIGSECRTDLKSETLFKIDPKSENLTLESVIRLEYTLGDRIADSDQIQLSSGLTTPMLTVTECLTDATAIIWNVFGQAATFRTLPESLTLRSISQLTCLILQGSASHCVAALSSGLTSFAG